MNWVLYDRDLRHDLNNYDETLTFAMKELNNYDETLT